MSELDQALVKLEENPSETSNQHAFYDLFLNSVFLVPTYDVETEGVAKEAKGEEEMLPLILQADGANYMVFFDSEERVEAWAEEKIHCLALPGFVIAEMSSDELYWGMNVGTEYEKQFVPEEIAWLKEVVRQSRAAQQEAAQDD